MKETMMSMEQLATEILELINEVSFLRSRLKFCLQVAVEALEYAEQDFDSSEETRIKAQFAIAKIREPKP